MGNRWAYPKRIQLLVVFVAIALPVFEGLRQVLVPRGFVVSLPVFHSATLGNDRQIAVYLPPNYYRMPQSRFDVLYMQDGQNVFTTTPTYTQGGNWHADEIADILIGEHQIRPLIIVAISSTAQRADEYLPTRAYDQGGNARLYTEMIVKELMPIINRRFRTNIGPKHTGACGSSFGGLVSLYMGLTRPDVFGQVGSCSPSVWWDSSSIFRLLANVRANPRPRVWIDIGTQEGDGMAQGVEKLRESLSAKGWSLGSDLMFVEEAGEHNEIAWRRRFPRVLRFLFGN